MRIDGTLRERVEQGQTQFRHTRDSGDRLKMLERGLMLGTIGYERSTLADFVATLSIAGVTTLADIRERAQSRRPGFSKRALAEALQRAGIEYLHFPQLGDPKAGRDAARAGNVQEFLEIYSAVMSSSAAQHALKEIETLVAFKSVCLMCFERDQNECHRKIVAEYLESRLGVRARHLGVKAGAGDGSTARRMLHLGEGAAASF